MVLETTDLLATNLTKEFNVLKMSEECAELLEVSMKYLTKNEGLKPKMEKFSEEMGDVVFRILVAAKALGIQNEVEKRIEEKAKQMHEWASVKFAKTE